MALLAPVTLMPGQLGSEPRLGSVREVLGTKSVLVRLREIGAAHLGALAPPVGFGPRPKRRWRRRRHSQQETGPDPPRTSRYLFPAKGTAILRCPARAPHPRDAVVNADGAHACQSTLRRERGHNARVMRGPARPRTSHRRSMNRRIAGVAECGLRRGRAHAITKRIDVGIKVHAKGVAKNGVVIGV